MPGVSRRKWFAAAGGLVAGLGLGGLYRIIEDEARGEALLRPPGARDEREFLAACLRCGQCVQACPYHTLLLTDITAGVGGSTPHVVARDVPCYLCTDHDEPLCIAACPSRALEAVAALEDIRMGLAVIDESICWAFNDTICRACWHACPWPDEAIRLNERLRPVVDPDACVGCGLCEHACPTEPSSIVVRPESVVSRETARRVES